MCVPGKQRIFWAIFETKKKKTTNKQEIQPPANPKPHHPKATRTQVQKTSSKRQDTSLKGRGRLWVGGTAEGPQIRCFTINTYCNVQSQYWTGTTSPGEIKAQHFLRVHTGAWGQSEGGTYRANQRQARRGAGSKTRGLKNSLVPLPFQSRNIQDPHQNILSQSRDYASKKSDQVQEQPLKNMILKDLHCSKKAFLTFWYRPVWKCLPWTRLRYQKESVNDCRYGKQDSFLSCCSGKRSFYCHFSHL